MNGLKENREKRERDDEQIKSEENWQGVTEEKNEVESDL